MTTYTEHKLTDSMLQRLSKTCKGRSAGGNSMYALEARGLVRKQTHMHPLRYGPPREIFDGWEPTIDGRLALAKARREGW